MTERDSNRKSPVAGEKSRSQDGPGSGSGPDVPAPAGPSAFSGAEKMPFLCLLLGSVVLWTFFPVIDNDFVNYDDGVYVTENIQVQQGLTWEGIGWAFSSSTASNWHPLTWLSHMMDCQLYGLQPWGHHLTSVLLHTANVLLLFVVLTRMMGLRRDDPQQPYDSPPWNANKTANAAIAATAPQAGATWRNLLVAALFGLHPLHVQSVAWVAERKDVLSTLFWLLTLIAYTRYVTSDKWQVTRTTSFLSRVTCHVSPYYFLALFFFICGLMSKPMLVALPCVLLLLDCWPLERWKHKSIGMLVAEKAPFFLLAVIASVVTFMVQKSGGAVGTVEEVPWFVRMGNALVSYSRYLGKMFWPVNLAVLYPHPGRWPAWVVLLSGLLLLGISVLVVALRRQRPWLPVGWFWFVGTLVPVIGLVQVGEQSMADRYTYVPMIGVLILFAWGIHELTGRWRYRRVVLFTVATAVVLPCILLTRQQIGYWKDSETLFRRAIAVAGSSRTACYKLGVALGKQGHFDEAISQFQAALKLEPNDLNVLYALGMAWNGKGRLDEAIASFQEVLRLKPDYADAHNNLGFVLSRKGRLDEAISQYQEALRLKPDYVNVRNNLGVALGRKGRLDEAIEQFQEALRLEPHNVGVLYNLGLALNGKGRLDDAIASFREVLKLKPDYADAHDNLGLVLGKEGRWDEAISQFQEVLRLDPNNAGTRSNLAARLRMKDAPGRQPAPSTQP